MAPEPAPGSPIAAGQAVALAVPPKHPALAPVVTLALVAPSGTTALVADDDDDVATPRDTVP